MGDVQRVGAIIFRENDGYVSLCPELHGGSQGASVEEAFDNLRDAVGLFIETASPSEIEERLLREVYVTTLEVAAGPQTIHSRKTRPCFAALATLSGVGIIKASSVQKVLDEDGAVGRT